MYLKYNKTKTKVYTFPLIERGERERVSYFLFGFAHNASTYCTTIDATSHLHLPLFLKEFAKQL